VFEIDVGSGDSKGHNTLNRKLDVRSPKEQNPSGDEGWIEDYNESISIPS
jgi:hypothetical protein